MFKNLEEVWIKLGRQPKYAEVHKPLSKYHVGTWRKALEKFIAYINNEESVASEESIKNMGAAVDYWNPLWRDDNYAANTRWGGIIAPPMYEQKHAYSGSFGLNPTPECGHPLGAYIGEDWEFFKPIRVNDSFIFRHVTQEAEAVIEKIEKRINLTF